MVSVTFLIIYYIDNILVFSYIERIHLSLLRQISVFFCYNDDEYWGMCTLNDIFGYTTIFPSLHFRNVSIVIYSFSHGKVTTLCMRMLFSWSLVNFIVLGIFFFQNLVWRCITWLMVYGLDCQHTGIPILPWYA